MRIFVHDYGGHPFPVRLSRELARRGHEVCHLYALFFQIPKGGLVKNADDPDGLTIEALDIGEPLRKYDFLPRLRQEIRYGHLVARIVMGNYAGRVAAPDDIEAVVANAEALFADPDLCETLGRNA